MKSPYVSELQPNQVINACFVVQLKDVRQKRSGEPYLSLILGDRTGDLDAKMWDNVAEVLESFEKDDFLRVKGLVQVHQNRLQLTLHKLTKLAENEVDFTDYFPSSRRPADEMMAELSRLVAGIRNEPLRNVLEAILADPEISSKLRVAPAAKVIHHAYLGGLLEHILSVAQLGIVMAAHYPHIDVDLMIAGAMLHDIGKIQELTYQRSFGYSTEGQMLGHIVQSIQIFDEKRRQVPDFPAKLRTLIEHMILSHHGELEYGSPKLPLFPEALLLHHLDNLDSKMEAMRAHVEKDRFVDGCWTGYNNALDRVVLKKQKYLDDEPAAAPVPDRAAAPAPHPPAAPTAGPKPTRPERNSSPFGEKLALALRKEP